MTSVVVNLHLMVDSSWVVLSRTSVDSLLYLGRLGIRGH